MSEPAYWDTLKDKYTESGPERIGFIVRGKVVEVENNHPLSKDFFEISLEDQEAYLAKASAVWHTQPGRTSQLSYEDYLGFLNFPEHKHIVIGYDGLRVYKVEDGQVLKDSVSLRYPENPNRS